MWALSSHCPNLLSARQEQQLSASRTAFVTHAGGERGVSFVFQTVPALQISDGEKNKKPNTLISVFTVLGQLP